MPTVTETARPLEPVTADTVADSLASRAGRGAAAPAALRAVSQLRTALALAVTALVFAAPAAGAATASLSLAAAGDSYASGEGAIGRAWIDAGCHRSSLAGPEDAARW